MHGPHRQNRRTVLKTLGTGVALGTTLGATGAAASPPGNANGRRNILEIVGKHDHHTGEHLFELSTHEIPAGWTTIEFDNQTTHTHFVYTSTIPQQAIDDAEAEGMDLLEFWIETVTDPFQYFMDTFVPGKEPDEDDLSDIYDTETGFPPWFGDVTWVGGPGLTSGGRSSSATVLLDPGKYIVECYVKDDTNDFHSYLGMIDLLSVTDIESDVEEPDATLDLTLTNDGIEVPDRVRPGQHNVAVEFAAQQGYANLVGHDVNLIRFDDETNADDVNAWMNWADPTQLISDGTEPGTFVGGITDIWTVDLPRTGYFHVNLKPGDYAWVAEVPNPKGKGLLEEFTVPFGQGTGRH